jgi:hypothetical protein
VLLDREQRKLLAQTKENGRPVNKERHYALVIQNHTAGVLRELETFAAIGDEDKRRQAWSNSRFGRTLELPLRKWRTDCFLLPDGKKALGTIVEALHELEIPGISHATVAMICLFVLATDFQP